MVYQPQDNVSKKKMHRSGESMCKIARCYASRLIQAGNGELHLNAAKLPRLKWKMPYYKARRFRKHLQKSWHLRKRRFIGIWSKQSCRSLHLVFLKFVPTSQSPQALRRHIEVVGTVNCWDNEDMSHFWSRKEMARDSGTAPSHEELRVLKEFMENRIKAWSTRQGGHTI